MSLEATVMEMGRRFLGAEIELCDDAEISIATTATSFE